MRSVVVACTAAVASGQELFLRSRTSETATTVDKQKPNFVWFLTDDQDQLQGGSFPPTLSGTPMPKTKALMQDGGAHAENWYIHTPICSPSRGELLTGRYFHNIKQVGGEGYCSNMHVNFSYVNNNTFAKVLQEQAGYTVGLFGKYADMPDTVPPGFDAWFANNGGDYIAPSFEVAGVEGFENGTWQGTADDYSTSVIGNVSIAWIKKVGQQDKPFMAYIAPKAAHEPFNPAPWYRDAWDPSWPEHEPRGENWNCSMESRAEHPGSIPLNPYLTENASRLITGVWRNRWRTLMSVDDLIAEVVQTVEDLGLSDRTYFFYSSDHGFQLGQFNILMDKRRVYEWDTKIHLLVRGPGIEPGSSFSQPGTQVDIAPTLLGLAGLETPDSMDGKSVVPFILDAHSKALASSTKRHLTSIGDLQKYQSSWRQDVFIEMYYCEYNIKCVDGPKTTCKAGNYPAKDSTCVDLTPGANADCWCQSEEYPVDPEGSCYATEDPSNNFIAVRNLTAGENVVYVEYQTGDLSQSSVNFDKVDFVEYYDLQKDDVQMHNLAKSLNSADQARLSARAHEWLNCAGKSCP